MKPTYYVISSVGVFSEAPRHKVLALIAAAIFLSLLAIGIAAGYSVAPSMVIALAATYIAQMLYLTTFIWRESYENAPELKAGTAIDRWLGGDIGDLGTVRPGSFEAAMHRELGILSTAHGTPISSLAAAAANEGPDSRLLDRQPTARVRRTLAAGGASPRAMRESW